MSGSRPGQAGVVLASPESLSAGIDFILAVAAGAGWLVYTDLGPACLVSLPRPLEAGPGL